MRDCTKGVAKKSRAKDPGAVCGALWHHKMSPAAKREALAREKRRTRKKTGKKTGRKQAVRATRGMAPGFYAVGSSGKVVAGPFDKPWEARKVADRSGGYVQYEPKR